MINDFTSHLEKLTTNELPTIKDVFRDRVKKTIEFNNSVQGQHVFCPTKNYDEEYSRYSLLSHSQRMKSDAMCFNIWGVRTNIDLYQMWYNHMNKSTTMDDTIEKAANDILSKPVENIDSEMLKKSPLLNPYDMEKKGVYNDDEPELNFYKCKGYTDKLLNGTPIKEWFGYYKKMFSNIECPEWDDNYVSWIQTVKNLLNKLDTINNINESKPIKQSLVELGWIPSIKFTTKSTMNNIHSNITRSEQIVDISDMELGEDESIKDNFVFILLSESGRGKYKPYLTLDNSDLYLYTGGELKRVQSMIEVRNNANTYLLATKVDDETYKCIKELLDNIPMTDSIVRKDRHEGFINKDDILKSGDILYKIFIRTLLTSKPNISKENKVDLISMINGCVYLVLKDVKFKDIKTNEVYGRLNNIKPIEESCDLLEYLREHNDKLSFIKAKPIAEMRLKGNAYDLFNVVYEQIVGEQFETKLINEYAIILGYDYGIINESDGYDSYTGLYRDILKEEDSVSKIYLLNKLNESIESDIYSSIKDSDKVRLNTLRYEVLKSVQSELDKELEKNPSFNIDNKMRDLDKLSGEDFMIKHRHPFSTNYLRSKR